MFVSLAFLVTNSCRWSESERHRQPNWSRTSVGKGSTDWSGAFFKLVKLCFRSILWFLLGCVFLEWMALTGNMLFSPSCCAAIAGWPGGAIDWYSKPAGSSYPHCFKCSVALSQQICSDGNAEFRHLWRVSGWCCVKKGTIMQLAQTV